LQLLVLSLLSALASSCAEHLGPEDVAYSNLCDASHQRNCLQPQLSAGLPLPFLFDTPGLSVERQLSFLEDEFRPAPFWLDVAAFALFWLLVQGGVRRLRASRSPST
jgi:hypothetical protein